MDTSIPLYPAQWENNAITVVVRYGEGPQMNQLSYSYHLFFDRHGHRYVADYWNDRVQRFSLIVD